MRHQQPDPLGGLPLKLASRPHCTKLQRRQLHRRAFRPHLQQRRTLRIGCKLIQILPVWFASNYGTYCFFCIVRFLRKQNLNALIGVYVFLKTRFVFCFITHFFLVCSGRKANGIDLNHEALRYGFQIQSFQPPLFLFSLFSHLIYKNPAGTNKRELASKNKLSVYRQPFVIQAQSALASN